MSEWKRITALNDGSLHATIWAILEHLDLEVLERWPNGWFGAPEYKLESRHNTRETFKGKPIYWDNETDRFGRPLNKHGVGGQ